ncbi:MAG: ribosome maturation factor RimP [Oscillospiraceae bacterium]|nr:ribosome maturation factor RimP [Oscillospiraceae bacterium]
MSRTAERAHELCRGQAESLGLTLWDVRYVKEGADYYLRFMIDKPGGVFIEDCEKLSRAIDPLLDEADFLRERYILEVSSPGIGRELCRPEHFPPFFGCDVTIKLIRPLNGIKQVTGKLVEFNRGAVTVELKRERKTFQAGEYSRINLFEEI